MLRNIKIYLASHENIDWYGLISLLIFFTVFIAMLIYVFKIPREKIDEIKNIPLNEKDETP